MNDWFKIKIPPSIGQNISEFGKRKGQFIFLNLNEEVLTLSQENTSDFLECS